MAIPFTREVVAVLASIGAAGVPESGPIMLTMVLRSPGVPLDVVGFVAGVDPTRGMEIGGD